MTISQRQSGIAPTRVNGADPFQVARAIGTLGEAAKTGPYGVRISAGAEAANVRRISFQVIDRQGQAVPDRFVLRVDASDAAYGAPVNTQALAAVSGTVVLRELVADQSLDLLTDSAGLARLDVTIVGAASRWFHAGVGDGKLWESAEIAWV